MVVNNLAGLLCMTNRLAEAEPLLRRALKILLEFAAQTGHEHSFFQGALANFFGFIRAAGRDEAQARAEIAALLSKYGIKLDQKNHGDVTKRGQNKPAPSRKVKRNEPCPCGSGKKYKNCHAKPV
jgi:hypothetical protein